jgi:hypothetical protein
MLPRAWPAPESSPNQRTSAFEAAVQRCLEVRFRELNLPTSPPEEVHVDLVRRAVVAGHGGSIGEYAAKMSTGVKLDYAGGLAPWQLRYADIEVIEVKLQVRLSPNQGSLGLWTPDPKVLCVEQDVAVLESRCAVLTFRLREGW